MTASLKRTPLYEAHVAAGARLVPYAGWEMPVQYKSSLDEHHATRRAAGLFDVSHMGEVFFEGPRALEALQRLVTNDLSACADGQAQYSGLLNPQGGFIDDVVVYRLGAERLLVCVNASNREKDAAWLIQEGSVEGCAVVDRSDEYGQIAIQGPKAAGILQQLTPVDLDGIRPFRFVEGEVAGVTVLIARTGYTGEDGFELFTPAAHTRAIWDALLEKGGPEGLIPAGLGARDSLRLEAGLRLYGNELNEEITPWEAGLGWIVKLKKGEFIGREALIEKKEKGLSRQLVGFRLEGKGIARTGYPVLVDGEPAGHVTSGTLSPSAQASVGFAYVPPAVAQEGATFEIEIRGRPVPAVVVRPPFHKS